MMSEANQAEQDSEHGKIADLPRIEIQDELYELEKEYKNCIRKEISQWDVFIILGSSFILFMGILAILIGINEFLENGWGMPMALIFFLTTSFIISAITCAILYTKVWYRAEKKIRYKFSKQKRIRMQNLREYLAGGKVPGKTIDS